MSMVRSQLVTTRSLLMLSVAAMEAANNMDEEDDDEVPDLVENFDEVSKNETATEDAKISEVPGLFIAPLSSPFCLISCRAILKRSLL